MRRPFEYLSAGGAREHFLLYWMPLPSPISWGEGEVSATIPTKIQSAWIEYRGRKKRKKKKNDWGNWRENCFCESIMCAAQSYSLHALERNEPGGIKQCWLGRGNTHTQAWAHIRIGKSRSAGKVKSMPWHHQRARSLPVVGYGEKETQGRRNASPSCSERWLCTAALRGCSKR